MGHSIGDGIIVVALAAAFLGYFYLRYLGKQRRLELVHAERLAAMDKGVPLPELPIDPPPVVTPGDRHVPLIFGMVFLSLGGGTMATFALLTATREYWPLPLPFALLGLGFVLYHFLAADRTS